jgi:hypothetical protein
MKIESIADIARKLTRAVEAGAITQGEADARIASLKGACVFVRDTPLLGKLEYVQDGWVGIRQPHEGNRLDEYQANRVAIDPT